VRLSVARCEQLLRQTDHGVLATLHPERGVDAVPACFVASGTSLGVPIDRVKQKVSADLQRIRNLDRDPRAALLCEHWDRSDWSRLWWVRASLERTVVNADERSGFESLLRLKYPQYGDEAIADVLVFRITGITGWAASAD
jgi:hypothetical protein